MLNWKRKLVLAVFTFTASSALSQESSVMEAYRSGEIKGKSLVVLPPDNAHEIGGNGEDIGGIANFTKAQERDVVDHAYPLMASKWPFNVVYVCWESPTAADAAMRQVVQDAVTNSWEKNSGLSFRGWNTCSDNSAGIRIQIEDSGPHTKGLGKFLDKIRNGMVLNFTYSNWSQSCKSMIEYCTRAIAVHEFGHAIGFAHEQNRPDTPGECTEEPQGSNGDTLLTPWDAHSVMNYCNEKYSNDGVLSDFDMKAVQYIYGLPK